MTSTTAPPLRSESARAAAGRSRWRRAIAVTAALGLVGALVACASEPAEGELETVRLALDWYPNTNHTGLYTAIERGYFEEAGLAVEVLPYNDTPPETLVDAGVAEFGVSFQDSTTFSIAAGARVQSVLAVLQSWVTAIGVRADDDEIQRPADLDGLLYAGFGTLSEGPLLSQVIRNDGGDGVFDSVILGTSAYEALYSGDADFTIPFVTWEGIEAELRGTPMKYFPYSDYGFPDAYALIIVGGTEWLAQNPETGAAFVQALQRGYEDAIAEPEETAEILLARNAEVLTEPELVVRSQQLLSEQFMLDPDGVFGVQTEQQWAELGSFFYEAGLLAGEDGSPLSEEPDWSTFFTNDFVAE